MVEIADFVAHGPVPADIIEEYRGRVPDELVEVWERYGYGTFADGFLRVIDPKLYEAEVGDCIGEVRGSPVNIPVMVTGLGDLITWETDQFVAIQYAQQQVTGLGSTLKAVVVIAGAGLLLRRILNAFPLALQLVQQLCSS